MLFGSRYGMLKSQGVFKMISKESYKLLKKAAASPERCIPQEENPNLAIQLGVLGLIKDIAEYLCH